MTSVTNQFNGIHVVIIEDDESSVDVLIRILHQLKVSFTVIFDLTAAHTEIKALPRVDAIFLDLEMPMTNGYEILQTLQADPDTRSIPTVAYTAHTSEISRAREAGFAGFLAKPLHAGNFANHLLSILRGQGVWVMR